MQYRLNVRTLFYFFTSYTKQQILSLTILRNNWQSISKFILIRSSTFMSLVENVPHIGGCCRNISAFRFLKSKIAKCKSYDVSRSRRIHSEAIHCSGKDLAGTQDILSYSGTVPSSPGHLVIL